MLASRTPAAGRSMLPGLAVTRRQNESGTAKFDLTLALAERDGRVVRRPGRTAPTSSTTPRPGA